MARNVVERSEDRQVRPLSGSIPDGVDIGGVQSNGEPILHERPANLSVLLDIIDSMPDDMPSNLHDDVPQERDDP